jgi:hypothetical protein
LKTFLAFDVRNDDEFKFIFLNDGESELAFVIHDGVSELVFIIHDGETELNFSISDVEIYGD